MTLLAARCGLRGLGVRGPGPAAVAEDNTNLQPPPIDELIDNLTSSCRCLLDDLRRLPDIMKHAVQMWIVYGAATLAAAFSAYLGCSSDHQTLSHVTHCRGLQTAIHSLS